MAVPAVAVIGIVFQRDSISPIVIAPGETEGGYGLDAAEVAVGGRKMSRVIL